MSRSDSLLRPWYNVKEENSKVTLVI